MVTWFYLSAVGCAGLGPLTGGYIYEYHSHTLAFVLNGSLLIVAAALVLVWFAARPLNDRASA